MVELSLPADILQIFALRPPIESFPISQGSNSRTIGVHTGDGDFLWKAYQPVHSEASLRYECGLLTWLAGRGLSFAVPTPVPTADGDILCRIGGSVYALFSFIPGVWPLYTEPRQLENTGAGLAELHRVLAEYPTDPRPGINPYGNLATVHSAILNPYALHPVDLGLPEREPFTSLLAWWREEVAELQHFSGGAYAGLPRQVIHGDYTPSNTLHAYGRLTGIVDFEFACPDVRAMDVASGIYFSLRLWIEGDAWARAEAFCRGYANGMRLTEVERTALPWLMRLRNAVSKIFWLGKSLVDGTTEKQVLDMGDLQEFNRWLALNGKRVGELLGE